MIVIYCYLKLMFRRPDVAQWLAAVMLKFADSNSV